MNRETKRARVVARHATNSRPARALARGGLVASGVVHILIGVIAISVANGLRQRADQTGALDAVADVPGGAFVLWAAAISLFGLAVWQWTGPLASRPEGVVPNKLRDRLKALAFVAVALAAAVFAVGGRANAAETTHTISSVLIEIPGGIFVLMAIGGAVGAVGIAFAVRGITRRFREDIAPPDGTLGAVIFVIGVIGHVAKGVALMIVAALFIGGALFSDSSWTTGLDGAVRYLTTLPTGIWPLFFVAGGLIAHGLYLISRARYLRR